MCRRDEKNSGHVISWWREEAQSLSLSLARHTCSLFFVRISSPHLTLHAVVVVVMVVVLPYSDGDDGDVVVWCVVFCLGLECVCV